MIEQNTADVRVTAAESARLTRTILDAIGDPDDELTASAATRHRLEGAAMALDAISRPAP